MTQTSEHGTQISYLGELGRKSIHLSNLGIPAVYLHIDHTTGIFILIGMTVVSLAIDLVRHVHAPTRALLMKYFGAMLRKHEVDDGQLRLTGATWVLIAATLTLGVFPTIVGVTAFTTLSISDTSAALIGRRFGGRRFLDKTLVGSAAFALTSIGVVAFYATMFQMPLSFICVGIVAAVVSSIVEASSTRLRMDDNLSIPSSFALTMMAGEWCVQSLHLGTFAYLVP